MIQTTYMHTLVMSSSATALTGAITSVLEHFDTVPLHASSCPKLQGTRLLFPIWPARSWRIEETAGSVDRVRQTVGTRTRWVGHGAEIALALPDLPPSRCLDKRATTLYELDSINQTYPSNQCSILVHRSGSKCFRYGFCLRSLEMSRVDRSCVRQATFCKMGSMGKRPGSR